jgi:citronellol/citronellal dehydrogenase
VPDVLRPGVLSGLKVCVAGGGEAAGARVAALGAEVLRLDADLADEDAVTAAAERLGAVDVLVADGAAPFAAAGGGMDGLRVAIDGAWNAVRAITNAAFLQRGGKVLLLAPAPGAGEHAPAVGAALENAARTLSVEWARFGVRTVALLPADTTTGDDLAELVAFLASPGGDYFSGCAFSLTS